MARHLLSFAIFASSVLLTDAYLTKYSLKDVDSAAVCTDGSPANYYFKPGVNTTSEWIVYLEGGGWCYDAASCQKRCGSPTAESWNYLCTSKLDPHHIPLHGIFYPSNDGALESANKVFVKYCTSDAHMGNGSAFGWQFRGAAVVQSVLKDLVSNHGLGKHHSRVLFGGGSAGARGGMVHLDYVKDMIGSVASNVDVVGFLDSPAWIDVKPFNDQFPGFPYITQHVHRYTNVAHLGDECAAKYQGADAWKCMYGQYRLPTLKTPYFLVASQYDSYQLGNNVGHMPKSDEEKTYAEEFANATRQLLHAVKTSSQRNAVYSWACYNHCTSESHSGFDTHTCTGSTMDEALKQFLELSPRTSPQLQWVDSCTTFGCGSGCSEMVVV